MNKPSTMTTKRVPRKPWGPIYSPNSDKYYGDISFEEGRLGKVLDYTVWDRDMYDGILSNDRGTRDILEEYRDRHYSLGWIILAYAREARTVEDWS